MKVFRRDIEMTLKTLGVITIIALIALPVAWGYEKDRQARMWKSVVCAYRVEELTRRTSPTLQPDPAADACAVLERLGHRVDPESIAPASFWSLRRLASRQP